MPIADGGQTKGCAAHKPFKTKIEINLDIPETRYNFSTPRRTLTHDQEAIIGQWKSEHEDHVWSSRDLTVEGFARGGMGVFSYATFIAKPYDRYGMYYCPYIEKISVNVHYNTYIYIAKENQKGTCEFSDTLEHERKHEGTNEMTVHEVMDRLQRDLPEIIAYTERNYIPREEVDAGFADLNAGVNDAVKIYSEHMFKEMQKRNARVDSPEEYERVSALCPKEP